MPLPAAWNQWSIVGRKCCRGSGPFPDGPQYLHSHLRDMVSRLKLFSRDAFDTWEANLLVYLPGVEL